MRLRNIGPAFVFGFRVSPDGKQLATVLWTWTPENGALTPKDPRLCLFTVEDRRMRIVPHPPATLLGHLEWR
jgi:hypothetical protein